MGAISTENMSGAIQIFAVGMIIATTGINSGF